MTHAEAVRLIQQSPLKDDAGAIESVLKPSVRLLPWRRKVSSSSSGSYFGGRPKLPPGFQCPIWDPTEYLTMRLKRRQEKTPPEHLREVHQQMITGLEGQIARQPAPLAFLAQINLSDVARVMPESGLPRTGVLAFFFDVENTPAPGPGTLAGCRVIHSNMGEEFTDAPASVKIFPQCAVRTRCEYTLPTDRLADLELPLAFRRTDEFSVLQQSMMPRPREKHRLGGWPNEIQNDMRPQCQRALADLDEAGAKSGLPHPTLNDWQLLLQLDSDDKLEWKWGDIGMLYFWICREDLVRADFSRVVVFLQCY